MANETREPGSANARDKRRRRVAAVALACTVLGVTVGALVIDATIGAPASTRSRDSTVEATVAAAEDIEVAYPYPLPPDTQPPQLFDANSLPHAWIDPNTHHAYIPPAVITRSLARLRDLCKAVFSAPMTSQVLQQANAALKDIRGISRGDGHSRRGVWPKKAKQRSRSLPMRQRPSSATCSMSSTVSGQKLASSVRFRLPHTPSTGLSSWA